MQILKTDEKFPEPKDIVVGETIDVLLSEDRFNELYNEIKWINGEEQTKSDFYKITFAGINFNITKK